MVRYVFLNSLPLNAFDKPFLKMLVSKVDPKTLKLLVANALSEIDDIKCYIRHPVTVELLNKMLNLSMEPSSELYKYQDGDVLFVVSLKKPIRGQEVNEISIDDLDIRMVEVVRQ